MYNYQNKYTEKIIEETKEVRYSGRDSDMLSGTVNKIIQEIVEETDFSLYEVTNAIKSIFRFVSEVLIRIKRGFFGDLLGTELPIVKLKYFGKFTPSKYRIKNMVKHLLKKKRKC